MKRKKRLLLVMFISLCLINSFSCGKLPFKYTLHTNRHSGTYLEFNVIQPCICILGEVI
jgi:hypothetical protein